jgi:diguanylate cyclase (GGDEF)-like protein/PAS domain S-box-containing protein
MEYRLRRHDGVYRWIDDHGVPLLDNMGNFSGYIGSCIDITESKQQQQQLKQLSLEQHAMLDNDLIGIVKVKDRRILWKNKAMDRIFGYQADELIGASMRILYPDFLAYQALGDSAYPILHATGSYRGQLEMLRKDGQKIWVDQSGGLLSQQGTETIWLLADITQMKQHETEIANIAYHDILTGLPNRLLLFDRLKQSLAQAERSKRMLAVCYLDLDGFKPINDNYGHQAGDQLLIEIANRMQATVRSNDTVGRLGGDEFVLLLTDLENEDEFQLVVERLSHAINQPISLGESIHVKVGVSIGITVFPTDSDDPDILLRHADQAMYYAKQSGRNKVCLFSSEQQ